MKRAHGAIDRPGWRRINLRLRQEVWDEIAKISKEFKCPMTEAIRIVLTWGLET